MAEIKNEMGLPIKQGLSVGDGIYEIAGGKHQRMIYISLNGESIPLTAAAAKQVRDALDVAIAAVEGKMQ